MNIVIASDHGGYHLKQAITNFLEQRGITVTDLGTTDANNSVDYPDFAMQAAEKVSQKKAESAILLCGTGIGMSIVANKFKGVRAAVIHDEYSAQMCKEHNNANIIALGGRSLSEEQAVKLVRTWLEAQFAGGRHARRLEKLAALEAQNF